MVIKKRCSTYPELDFLKGFAIIAVALYHLSQFLDLPGIFQKTAGLGGSGVHIFFFCSGFGLCLSQTKKELSYTEFVKKRFLKIYLPYIAVVLVLFLIPGTFEGNLNERVSALLSHVLLFKMFVPDLIGSFSYPLWYMSTLFQFYLIFIPLYRLKKKLGDNRFLINTCILSMLWWLQTALTGLCDVRPAGSFFLQYLWEFALGMYAAGLLLKRDIHLKRTYLLLAAMTGIPAGGILGMIGGPARAFNDLFLASGMLSLALLLYDLFPWIRALFIRMSWISFEYYLVHSPCFVLAFYLLKDVSVWVATGAALSFSLVVAIVFYQIHLRGLQIYNRPKGQITICSPSSNKLLQRNRR